MRPRWFVLAAMFILSAYLVVFGDKEDGDLYSGPQSKNNNLDAELPLQALEKPPDKSKTLPTETPQQEPTSISQSKLTSADTGSASLQSSLFSVHSWAPPAAPPPPVVELPEQAPPLPFTFIGKQYDGERWKVFLQQGSQVLVVSEGEKIGENYHVRQVTPPMMSLDYLPLHIGQQLFIGFGER